jgi:hypothetical protein
MREKKIVSCKRCDTDKLHWDQDWNGKWQLRDEKGSIHKCEDGAIKAVKCKYCKAEDLHWAEEINPFTKMKKMVLNESYGLPHACDARLAFIAKEKQDKKDAYAAEKLRIESHPDGPCPQCGTTPYPTYMHVPCSNCLGNRYFDEYSRKTMKETVRRRLWPDFVRRKSV